MRRVRVGVVGTGFAASSHVDALRRIPEVAIVAIAGSSREKGERAAAKYGIANAFGDYRELVASDVDAVHDCTPNFLHAEVNAAALEAGKHVLSEKPLALDAVETAALAEQAGAADAVAGVCFNYRHYPLVQQARAMLASGDYGRAHFVHGAYLQDWLLYETDWNWRLESAKAGPTRAVGDIGSHWLDLVEHVTADRVTSVFADLATLHPERTRPADAAETFAGGAGEGERAAVDTEDFGSVLLRFPSGCRGMFSVSQVSPGAKNRLTFEIDTATAALVWDQERPNELWVGRRDAPNAVIVRDPSLLAPAAAKLAHFPGGHQEGWPDGLRNLFLDFYAAVAAHREGREYEPTFATFADAHRTMQTVEAVAASNRERRWVEVGAMDEVPA